MIQNHHFKDAIMYVRNTTLNFIHTKNINKELIDLNEHYQNLCKELRSNPLFQGVTAYQIDIWISESLIHYPVPTTCEQSMINSYF